MISVRRHRLPETPSLQLGPPSHVELLISLKKLLEVGILYDLYGFKILKMKKKYEKVYVGLYGMAVERYCSGFDTIVITFKIIYPIKC